MERPIRVGGESMGLDVTGLPARALVRLDTGAQSLGALRTAEQPLAALSCARLTALTAPARHQQVIEGALAGPPAPPAQDLPRRSRPMGRVRPEFSRQRSEEAATGMPGRRSATTGRSPAAGPPRATRAGAPSVARAHRPQGLDWLVARMLGGEEASQTAIPAAGSPGVDRDVGERAGAPSDNGRERWQGSAGRSGGGERSHEALPADATHSRRTRGLARAARGDLPASLSPAGHPTSEPTRRVHHPGPPPAAPRAPAAPAPEPEPELELEPAAHPAGQLGVLVRTWSLPDPAGAETAWPVPPSGRAGRPAPDPDRRSPTPPEDELDAFGDTLARVLLAELARYGIEVDEG